jgi:hypothetical protein
MNSSLRLGTTGHSGKKKKHHHQGTKTTKVICASCIAAGDTEKNCMGFDLHFSWCLGGDSCLLQVFTQFV